MSAQPEFELARITDVTFATPEPTVRERLLAACDTDAVPVKPLYRRVVDASRASRRAIDALREYPSI